MGKADDPARYWREWVQRILAAWDALPVGYHSPNEVDRWLNKDIGPVIVRARAALNLHLGSERGGK